MAGLGVLGPGAVVEADLMGRGSPSNDTSTKPRATQHLVGVKRARAALPTGVRKLPDRSPETVWRGRSPCGLCSFSATSWVRMHSYKTPEAMLT